MSTLTRAGAAADQSSVSGGGTALCGRPTSACADRSTSTDLISAELVSPDLTSACVDAGGGPAVFRPIRRPYGTVSSQDEDFSYFDTEDDDDDDLRYRGLLLRPPSGRRAKYCDEHVCLSVYLSLHFKSFIATYQE